MNNDDSKNDINLGNAGNTVDEDGSTDSYLSTENKRKKIKTKKNRNGEKSSK